jgi:polyhydroxyalkanoate synthase
VVHRENKWSLLRYRPAAGGPKFQTPVLLVPSLINRHYVMDLLPGKSMAEDLVKAGHDVYCIDWGTPTSEDRLLSFDDICDRYLGRAIRKVAKASPRGKAHVLGYCLGGTLATIHASVHPEHIASLLVLAAPVRFTGAEGLLESWTKSSTFEVADVAAAFGNVPWQLMQAAFTMLRPTLGLSKAVHVVDKAINDDPNNANKWEEFSEGFRALETWGNDNVSFPGECYVRYIEQLYRGDALSRGTFTLSGKPARLEAITCPTLSIVFEHDNIVPWENAAVLVEKIASADKELLKLPGGHVGAVVSRSAQKKLWPRMSAFWAARDTDARAVAAASGASDGLAVDAPRSHRPTMPPEAAPELGTAIGFTSPPRASAPSAPSVPSAPSGARGASAAGGAAMNGHRPTPQKPEVKKPGRSKPPARSGGR